jgi:hypothetical protein
MVLVGRLKMPYQDLFILSNREIDALVYGHEIDLRSNAEIQRAIGGLIVSPYAKKGYDVRKDIPFGWDEIEEHEPASKEDFDNARKMLDIVDKLRAERNGK